MHVVTDLDIGGAETQLLKLLAADARLRAGAVVVSLAAGGVLAPEVRTLGVPVVNLGLRPSRPSGRGLAYLVRLVREQAPDLLLGWLYHGSLAAQIASQFAPQPTPVIWNIRQSVLLRQEKLATRLVIRGLALASRRPACIVYNSHRGARGHEALGFRREKTRVVPNGFATEEFCPQPDARAWLRRQLDVAPETILVGMFGRYTPWKDYPNFLRAAAVAKARVGGLHFVLTGPGVDDCNGELRRLVAQNGLGAAAHCLGTRRDVARIMAGLDLATSASVEEGFPNAVAEAMAVGLTCVVTDAGDSGRVVGDCGVLVATQDPGALAGAWLQCLDRGAVWRAQNGERARARIVEHFSVARAAAQYGELFQEVAAGGKSR